MIALVLCNPPDVLSYASLIPSHLTLLHKIIFCSVAFLKISLLIICIFSGTGGFNGIPCTLSLFCLTIFPFPTLVSLIWNKRQPEINWLSKHVSPSHHPGSPKERRRCVRWSRGAFLSQPDLFKVFNARGVIIIILPRSHPL